MNRVIGFIGAGNMAEAMIGGILKAGVVAADRVVATDLSKDRMEFMKNTYGIRIASGAVEVAAASDLIVLAVKPDGYNAVMQEIKDSVKAETLIVTIASGKTLEDVESVMGSSVKVVRTMPNTPALVGEGMAALCPNKNITEDELQEVRTIFESFGKAEVMPEKLIDAVVGISGSSPAYVFMFIEALADAGVKGGMPRDKAYRFAAQAVLGSAKMVLETGKHPGALKDMVCSPGGTTIEAVSVLEACGFRSAVMEAVDACIEKASSTGKK